MSQDKDHVPRDVADEQQLDALVSQSLKFEVDADRVGRLQQYWNDQQRVELRRRWPRRALAVAASIAVLVAWTALRRAPERPVLVEHAIDGAPLSNSIGQTKIDPAPLRDKLADQRPISNGRTPTAYEQAMFMTRTLPRVESSLSVGQRVGRAIDRMADEPTTDPTTIIRAASKQRRPVVKWAAFRNQLLQVYDEASPERKIAICRLLATNDQKRATAMLLALSGQSQARDSSLAAIEQVVGAEQWPRVARDASDSKTRRAIARRLLESDTDTHLVAFVKMVEDKVLREDALESAKEMAELPVAELIALLDSKEPTVRLATAITLGQLNRCEMTASLITRIHDRPSQSTEAWFALFACECEAADHFLIQATYDPKLLGQFNNARLQWVHASH